MATKYWAGTVSTSYATAGNWEGGVAPIAGDTVIFPAGSNTCAGSDQSGTALAAFIVDSGYTGTIGSSGTPLIIDTNILSYAGQGTSAWISAQNGAAAANIQLDVLSAYSTSAPTTEGLHLLCNSTDIFEPCRIHGGTVSFDATSRFTTLLVAGGTVYVNSATGATTAFLLGGTVYYDAAVTLTTLNCVGGTWYHSDDANGVTTINVWGGTVNYQGVGTVTTLNVYLSTAIFTAADSDHRFTITTCNIYEGDVYITNKIGTPTFTNPVNYYGNGQLVGGPARTGTAVTAL